MYFNLTLNFFICVGTKKIIGFHTTSLVYQQLKSLLCKINYVMIHLIALLKEAEEINTFDVWLKSGTVMKS